MIPLIAYMRTRLAVGIRQFVKDETGAQTIEWIALGILIMAMMAGAAAIVKNDNSLGQTIIRMIERILDQMGTGSGTDS
jgi:Flp pilus assembly pilin Flp